MWPQTISHHFKTYPDYFEIQHSNSPTFSILYINKQHKIIPWSNKENKHLAVLLWFPMQTLSFDPKGEEVRSFNFLLMEPYPWEVHITTKISRWEKKTPATWLFCLHYGKSPQCFQTPSSSFLNSGIACLRVQLGETFSLRNVDLKD